MHAVRKYLRDRAEPEVRLAESIDGTYERALVVPACREEASLLDGYVAAAETSGGRTLCILVVNGADDASEEHHRDNAHFLDAVVGKLEGVREIRRIRETDGPPGAFLGTLALGRLDVLVVDRASAGARVPRKEGVGLARRIGFDLALALHAQGRVRSALFFGTDADATLPDAFFDQRTIEEDPTVAAAVFAFWHTAAGDPDVTRATAFYELSLRYYVEGLAWAGSPYAFHTVGSATAVMADAYAAVRGMPKREAAEDFYLLNKLAKVGKIVHVPGSIVRLSSRMSDRTPFGTGASVRQAIVSPEWTLYSPACFAVLRDLLFCLDAFAAHGDANRFFSQVAEFAPGERAALSAVFEQWGATAALGGATREAKTVESRRLRVHTWFDAFRTLKLIHAARDRISPNLPWKEALEAAPFLGSASASASDPALVTLRVQMARAEGERWERSSGRARGAFGRP